MMRRLHALPIRWKLALSSAALTFAILTVFALVIGLFAGRQVRAGFDDDLRATAGDLQAQIGIDISDTTGLPEVYVSKNRAALDVFNAAAAGDARLAIVYPDGEPLVNPGGVDFGEGGEGIHDVNGYRVVGRAIRADRADATFYLQYGKPLDNPQQTVKEIRIFLTFGVIGGTLLALLAGLAIARRAMAPIANLTRVAGDIARTRDPDVPSLPKPNANDEVAELARTLEQMLEALDAAQTETQAALARQREFVADASHELRTPLTAVLSNLELLEQGLHGEDAEMVESALRSSRRMKRLVADLLLLARADTGRVATRQSIDLTRIAREAVSEAAPLAGEHELTLALPDPGAPGPRPVVFGTPDDLHRLILNLVQNAIAHTPAGTAIDVTIFTHLDFAIIEVADNGPGIPAELRSRLFDRFVRGSGDSGRGGSGLGLAIVQAVAEGHFGSVELAGETEGRTGARFIVKLPLAPGMPGSTAPPKVAPAREQAPAG